MLITPKTVIEIALLFLFLYSIIRFIRERRGGGILKGLALLVLGGVVLLFVLVKQLDLPVIQRLIDELLPLSVIALLIVFQPELRMGLIRLGQNPFPGGSLVRSDAGVVKEIVKAVGRMAKDRVGAIIALERENRLGAYAEGKSQVEGIVSSALLETIFWPGSSLHDGAVIIKKDRISAAGCFFPLSDNPALSQRLGSRHRAAIGISEISDAIVIVVSEERGAISIASGGRLEANFTPETLQEYLDENYLNKSSSSR